MTQEETAKARILRGDKKELSNNSSDDSNSIIVMMIMVMKWVTVEVERLLIKLK